MAIDRGIRRLLARQQNGSLLSAGVLSVALLAGCEESSPPLPSPPEITTASPLPRAIAGQEYAVALQARHGQPPLAWSGSPPAGLQLEAQSGRITGTPGAEGSFPFEITVIDNARRSNTKSLEITITRDVPLAITTPSPLPGAIVGQRFVRRLNAIGGRGELSWSSSDLADDFTLDPSAGSIGGTPARAGTFSFYVRVTDGAGQCATRRFALAIDKLVITTRTLPDARKDQPYSQEITTRGGALPLTGSADTLPAGLTLSATGDNILLRGTPADTGEFNFTLTVTDDGNPPQSATQPFKLKVADQGQCASRTVRMENLQFAPEVLPIKPCDIVVWEHRQGSTPHTVTSGGFEAGDAGAQFDSRGGNPAARMREPDTFSHTFNSAGTFPYHCTVHGGDGGMNGTITVSPNGAR